MFATVLAGDPAERRPLSAKALTAAVVLAIAVTCCVTVAARAYAAPANDNFANATVVTGTTGTSNSDTTDATLETFEPPHYGEINADGSVWFKWTAPQTGYVSFYTNGGFDSVMAAYLATGSGFSGLRKKAANDQDPLGILGNGSRVTFWAATGSTYYIAVTGYDAGSLGALTLGWDSPPVPALDNPDPRLQTGPAGEAGSDYTLIGGRDLVLDGTASTFPDGSSTAGCTFEWGLGAPGDYTAGTGSTASIPWATVSSALASKWTGYTDPQTGLPAYTVRLRVTSGGTVQNWDTAALRVYSPVTTTSNVDGAWHNTPVIVALSSPGAVSTHYSTDGGSTWHTYMIPFTISAEGVTPLEYYSTDTDGNSEPPVSKQVKIDLSAPVSSDNAPSPWYRTNVSVRLSATDAFSGVASTRYSVNGAASTTFTSDILVSAEGTTNVAYSSVDNVGNRETTKTVAVRVDHIAPVTTSNALASYTSTPTILLVPTDSTSGVATTYWRMDAGSWNTGIVATVQSMGSHTLQWYSVDVAGNTESVESATFTYSTKNRFEQDDPRIGYKGAWSTLVSSSRSGGSYAYSSATSATAYVAFVGTTLDVIASKLPNAGIARLTLDARAPVLVDLYSSGYLHQAKVYSVTGLASGSHTLKIEVTGTKDASSSAVQANLDAIDTDGELQSAWPFFDTTPPVTTSSPDDTWQSGDTTVTLSATDDLSGIATILYRVDGGATTVYGSPFTVSKNGTSTVEFWSVDNAGRVETTHVRHVRIDRTSPGIAWDAHASYNGTATISIVASDAVSGIGTVESRIDGGPWSSGPTLATNIGGQHTIEARAIDLAGNVSAPLSANISIQKRFEQDDPRLGWSASWTTYASSSRSGGSYVYSSVASSTAYANFTGTSLAIISSKLPSAGIMRVALDNNAPVMVDLYSAGFYHQQTVFSAANLANGPHTVTITYTGAKNPLSSSTQINVDAFDSIGELTQWSQRYEQTDPHVVLEGLWVPVTNAAHSAGSYAYAYSPGAAADIAFVGTGITWVAPKGTVYGIAQVSMDGGSPATVDLYSSKYSTQQTVWSVKNLPNTAHTVRISVTGTKNAASSDYNVGVDALDVAGYLTQAVAPAAPGTLYEQTDPKLVYDGSWVTANSASYSAGSYAYATALGAAVNARFTGTDVTIVAPKGPSYGIAAVSLDGGAPSQVDLYASKFTPQAQVWSARGLTATSHTVRVVFTGTKNAAATSNYVGLDALRIVGTLTQATSPNPTVVRSEDNTGAATYLGSWATYSSASYSGGSYHYTTNASATVTFAFSGTGLKWIAPMGPAYGIARVSIDGGTSTLVDLYASKFVSPSVAWTSPTLAAGHHTLKISSTGTKNASAATAYVGVDAFDVTP